MAPVEIDVIPRDVVAAPVAHLKIVDKAFELPLINDTYNEVSRLAAPLSPFVETVKENAEKVTPMLESGFITIKTTAEEKLFPQLPEGTTANIQAKLDTAKEKVTSAVVSLDSLACVGLDQLTAKVPALKEATPELIETAKDTTVTYAEYAKEYVASFGLAQIALKLGDKGLQIATDALKLAGLEETKHFKPVLSGIKTIRRNARAVRRAGAKVAGIEPAKTIGEASLLGAVAEIVGLNFFLSVVGLQLVPANILSNAKTTELDTSVEEETVGDKLSNDRIASYVSDEDPDFVPSDASADSAEDDSEGEEAIVEVVEEVKEKIEDAVEEVVKEIEDDVEEVVKEIEDVVEEVVDEIEDVVEEIADSIEDVLEKIADKVEDLVVEVEDDVEEAGESDEDVVEVKADKIEEIAGKTEDIIADVEDVEEAGEADEELD
eukprot:TRINITY_DN9916_c0_g1_i5.p1 TRINITY_DN9916_c0_g1~~TRINITY_DN9916_c0_g1_i5.p1  ORF type:complete len:451 (-),score=144.23 TRINITY_DN9916_c0_g1_i5:71-1375(-)